MGRKQLIIKQTLGRRVSPNKVVEALAYKACTHLALGIGLRCSEQGAHVQYRFDISIPNRDDRKTNTALI
jgi:hypothetical protein